MKYQDFDRSAARVNILVWSIAVLALMVGGGVLTKVLYSLSSVDATYQDTEKARTLVSDSLGRLRTYRLQLMARINEVTSIRSADASDPFLLLDRRPGDYEQLVVEECGQIVTRSVIDLGGDSGAVAGTVDELCGGLERMHNSLQVAWTQTFVASETRNQCEAVRSRVRDELQTMLTLISKAVGAKRLQTAVGLAKIRNSNASNRAERLEDFVDVFEGNTQPQQLENDMRDLILQTEHLITLEDVDQLRSQKDNRIRQTMQRLQRNTPRLGKNAQQFAKHLQEYQVQLFGSGSQDDPQHQSMLTTGGGLYSLKVKLLQDQQLLRASRDRADEDARACQNAEMQVNSLVAILDGDVSEATHHKIGQASTSLFGIAAVAAFGFMIATAWIVRVVSRTMKQAQEQQRESSELARIIRDSPDELFIFSCETLKFVEANLGAQKSSGYSKDELTEMTPLDIKPKMSREQFHQLIRPLQAGEVASLEFQTDHKRKDGSLYPARISLHKAVYDQQDVFVAFVADVSAVQQLEQSLSKAQKLESVGQLAAGVAHEINTPMQFVTDNIAFVSENWASIVNAIDTCEELLTSDEPMSWQERKVRVDELLTDRRFNHARKEMGPALEECGEGCARVVRIVRAMKEFSHPGKQEKTPACVNDLVETTVTLTRNQWKQCAEVEVNLDPEVPQVPMLVSELNQVLLNLIVNASDAIQDRFAGSNELGQITIRTRSDEKFVVIEVEDNGGGIPDEIRARVFDPFFTTKDVGKGTGQGLAISQNVVANKHGGEIDIRTQPGEGTTFIVRLPKEPINVELGEEAAWSDDATTEAFAETIA